MHAALLEDYLEKPTAHLLQQRNLVAYPQQWQVPAATERGAFESMLAHGEITEFSYVGFPWATLIDSIQKDATQKWPLVDKLRILRKHLDAQGHGRRVTVAQHIKADRYIVLFKACGITDLFWSHKTVGIDKLNGIKIHPFPLFPAQTQNVAVSSKIGRQRRYLANFIGSYKDGLYLTNVREHILSDADKMDDLLIIRRNEWHFERAVYLEQLLDIAPSDETIRKEQQQKDEYIEAIRDSYFTICPTGSGPNSIRIYEALSLGSIPIILTKDLELASNYDLWIKSCIIDDDSKEGYERALSKARKMSISDRFVMMNNGFELFKIVAPENYAKIIINCLGS